MEKIDNKQELLDGESNLITVSSKLVSILNFIKMEKINNKKESLDGKSDLINVSSKLVSILSEEEDDLKRQKDSLKRQKDLLSQLGEKINNPLTIDENEMSLYQEFYELSKQKSDLISPNNLLRLKELFSQLGDKIDTPKEMNDEEMIMYIEFYELGKNGLNLTDPIELFRLKKFSLLGDAFYVQLRKKGSKEFESGCLLVSKLNEKKYLYNKITQEKKRIWSRKVFHNKHLHCSIDEGKDREFQIINIQSGEEKLLESKDYSRKIIQIGSKVEGLKFIDVKDVEGVERRIPCSTPGLVDLGLGKEVVLFMKQHAGTGLVQNPPYSYKVFDPDSESVILEGDGKLSGIERKIEEKLINIKFDSLKKHGNYFKDLNKGNITITHNRG